MEKETKMNYIDLEYSKLEKAEMITYLNKLLASYQVYVHKTRSFQWNVIGQDHFDLRQGFKNLSRRALTHMDEIAERIRLFNQRTIGDWREIVQTSDIKEASTDLPGFEMVKAAASDLSILLQIQTESIEKAIELNDYGTEIQLKNHMKELEQDYLLLVSWLK